MNKRKSLIPVLLTLLIIGVAFSLAGCGDQQEKPKPASGGVYYEGPMQKGNKKTE